MKMAWRWIGSERMSLRRFDDESGWVAYVKGGCVMYIYFFFFFHHFYFVMFSFSCIKAMLFTSSFFFCSVLFVCCLSKSNH